MNNYLYGCFNPDAFLFQGVIKVLVASEEKRYKDLVDLLLDKRGTTN